MNNLTFPTQNEYLNTAVKEYAVNNTKYIKDLVGDPKEGETRQVHSVYFFEVDTGIVYEAIYGIDEVGLSCSHVNSMSQAEYQEYYVDQFNVNPAYPDRDKVENVARKVIPMGLQPINPQFLVDSMKEDSPSKSTKSVIPYSEAQVFIRQDKTIYVRNQKNNVLEVTADTKVAMGDIVNGIFYKKNPIQEESSDNLKYAVDYPGYFSLFVSESDVNKEVEYLRGMSDDETNPFRGYFIRVSSRLGIEYLPSSDVYYDLYTKKFVALRLESTYSTFYGEFHDILADAVKLVPFKGIGTLPIGSVL